jgi:hypothetical protein
LREVLNSRSLQAQAAAAKFIERDRKLSAESFILMLLYCSSQDDVSSLEYMCMQRLGYGTVPFVIFKHEDLEREYNLHPAESNERKLESWQLTPVDAGKGDLKRQMASVVKPIVNLYRFQTIGEYRALLTLYNIGVEEVKGEWKSTFIDHNSRCVMNGSRPKGKQGIGKKMPAHRKRILPNRKCCRTWLTVQLI